MSAIIGNALVLVLFSILFAVSASAQKLKSVVIGTCPRSSPRDSALAYGIDHNIFKKYGIDLKVNHQEKCQDLLTDLAMGKARFAIADPLEVAISISGGAKVKFISSILQGNAMAFASLSENGIRSPKDLKGKRIAVLRGGRDLTILKALLKANNISEADVQIIEYPKPPDKTEALKKGSVEAAGIAYYAAQLWRHEIDKPITMMRAGEFGVAIPGDGVIVSTSAIESEQDRALNCSMNAAISEAYVAAGQNPKAAVESLKKIFKDLSPKESEGAQSMWVPYFYLSQLRPNLKKPFGFIFQEDWVRLLAILKDYRLTSETLPTTTYYTNEFISCVK